MRSAMRRIKRRNNHGATHLRMMYEKRYKLQMTISIVVNMLQRYKIAASCNPVAAQLSGENRRIAESVRGAAGEGG
jgi:hypothetical protein